MTVGVMMMTLMMMIMMMKWRVILVVGGLTSLELLQPFRVNPY